jgi:DNA-directed RNA polymerase subunit RPC12/RpoP
MSNASPPIVKVDACARCGKEKEAFHHTPGQKIEIWPSVTVPMVDPVTRKAREYTRILCPDCAKAQTGTEDLKRILEAEFAAISKA